MLRPCRTWAAPARRGQVVGAGRMAKSIAAFTPDMMSEPVDSWHSRLPCDFFYFQGRDASQQATQQVGPGDDAPLRTPHQDQIVVDNVVLRPLLRNLQVSDDLAESRPHVPNHDRPVPPRALILAGVIEQRVAQKM